MPLAYDDGSSGLTSTTSLGQYAQNLGLGHLMGPVQPQTGSLATSGVPPIFGLPVYMGTKRTSYSDTPRGFGSTAITSRIPKSKTIKQLTDELLEADRKEQKETAFLLVLAGYGPSADLADVRKVARSMTLGELVDAYHNLLESVHVRNQLGQKITPAQALREAIRYRLPAGVDWNGDFADLGEAIQDSPLGIRGGAGLLEEDEPFTGTKVVTDSNRVIDRNIMDPRDAKALTRAMLQQELGRDPTAEEFEDFIGTLQAAQREDPTITTTKTRTEYEYVEDELVDQSTTTRQHTKQGITQAGLADMAMEKARSQPGWAEWQAMGTYAPALFAALGATVPGAGSGSL